MMMDLPVSDTNLEAAKQDELSFECENYDLELIHKVVQVLLMGLASASVDNTKGNLFRGPAAVVIDLRKEMVEYLIQRSEAYVSETVIEEGNADVDTLGDPVEVISGFIDDFSSSKRNLFSRVSGWVLSEMREDSIDDFVQEMEMKGFWAVDIREAITRTLLKNIDYMNHFHCGMKFNRAEELEEHKSRCDFRPLSCNNEGCKAKVCAIYGDKHDLVCPYKVLPCEQNCSQRIMRRDMDRHCITVCPMKLVNCPFYQVGCQSSFPQCTTEKHCSEFIHSHLLFILQVIHKQEASMDELKQRVQLLEKSQSLSDLSEALDVRSLTLAVKEQEAKMKTLERDLGKKSKESGNMSKQVSELQRQVQSLQKRAGDGSSS
ncbi:hypothetical protein QJS04_geneDACA008699 [Acorus gramineus]|uniref:TRAF-type domain-containing protein n=1 Tax=Acorus gramineus TaxID=55184 RepID=A0AAV9AC54_ACOGR|nr:hypothetical protein QJS04_geneDACA008699 [Acorus gramineus]